MGKINSWKKSVLPFWNSSFFLDCFIKPASMFSIASVNSNLVGRSNYDTQKMDWDFLVIYFKFLNNTTIAYLLIGCWWHLFSLSYRLKWSQNKNRLEIGLCKLSISFLLFVSCLNNSKASWLILSIVRDCSTSSDSSNTQ